MWVFSKYGFFSAVQHANRDDVIHLKARYKGDLERLFEASRPAIQEIMEGAELTATVRKANAQDLGYYCDIPKEMWSAICAYIGNDVDYPYFNKCVDKGSGRARAYGDVYNTMLNARQ